MRIAREFVKIVQSRKERCVTEAKVL